MAFCKQPREREQAVTRRWRRLTVTERANGEPHFLLRKDPTADEKMSSESEERGAGKEGKKSSRGADIDLLPVRLIEQ